MMLLCSSASAMEYTPDQVRKVLLASINVNQSKLDSFTQQQDFLSTRVCEHDDIDDHQDLAAVKTQIQELKDNFKGYLIEDIFKSTRYSSELTAIIESIEPAKNDENAHQSLQALLDLYHSADRLSSTQQKKSNPALTHHSSSDSEDTSCSLL